MEELVEHRVADVIPRWAGDGDGPDATEQAAPESREVVLQRGDQQERGVPGAQAALPESAQDAAGARQEGGEIDEPCVLLAVQYDEHPRARETLGGSQQRLRKGRRIIGARAQLPTPTEGHGNAPGLVLGRSLDLHRGAGRGLRPHGLPGSVDVREMQALGPPSGRGQLEPEAPIPLVEPLLMRPQQPGRQYRQRPQRLGIRAPLRGARDVADQHGKQRVARLQRLRVDALPQTRRVGMAGRHHVGQQTGTAVRSLAREDGTVQHIPEAQQARLQFVTTMRFLLQGHGLQRGVHGHCSCRGGQG